MQRPIFFCHLPKTAGTSVRRALERRFAAHEIVPSLHAMEQCGGQYPPVRAVERALRAGVGQIRLLRGHYHYSIRRWLADPICIVMLREPVARAISEINHHMVYGGLTARHVADAFDSGRTPIPDNVMTRYLGGTLFDEKGAPLEERHEALLRGSIADRETLLRSAVKALDCVDLLGLSEHVSTFAHVLKRVTGAALGEERFNVSPRVEISLNDRELSVIRENNRLDADLYAYAQSLVLA